MTLRKQLFFTAVQNNVGSTAAIFLHGLWGGGNNLRFLDFSKLPFSSLYFPDELGFGKSPKPDISYTPKVHCQALFHSVTEGGKLTIVGYSFGAVLALYFASLYASRVKQVILISPPLYKDEDEARLYLSQSFISRLTLEKPWLAQLSCKALCKTRLLSLIMPITPAGKRYPHIQDCTSHTWQSYYSSFTNCLIKHPLIDLVTRVANKYPTLIIYGQNDTYIDSHTQAYLKGRYLRRIKVKNGKHDVLFEKFKECHDIIQNWLSSYGAGVGVGDKSSG